MCVVHVVIMVFVVVVWVVAVVAMVAVVTVVTVVTVAARAPTSKVPVTVVPPLPLPLQSCIPAFLADAVVTVVLVATRAALSVAALLVSVAVSPEGGAASGILQVGQHLQVCLSSG